MLVPLLLPTLLFILLLLLLLSLSGLHYYYYYHYFTIIGITAIIIAIIIAVLITGLFQTLRVVRLGLAVLEAGALFRKATGRSHLREGVDLLQNVFLMSVFVFMLRLSAIVPRERWHIPCILL